MIEMRSQTYVGIHCEEVLDLTIWGILWVTII